VSAIAVWLTTTRSALCWPVGLLSVLLYGYIFIGARLYSDALLQGIYAGLELYGWLCWARARAGLLATATRGATDRLPPVVRPGFRDIAFPLLAGLLGAVLLGLLTSTYTDAALPWTDAVLTGLSLVAQYWMARLYRINWLLWIAVDVVYVGVYVSRGLGVTAALYAAFLVLAALGWHRWGRASIR